MERRGRIGSGRSGRDGKEERGARGVKKDAKGRPIREKKVFKKKFCKFCINKIRKIDYLDSQSLRRYTTERGKILPSRITGACAKHQRFLSNAIKRARHAGLLPYLSE